ncbi:MAG: CinA family protein [Clostridia bacterium]|nr:CinA family protein [Clostridia bacterium]
MKEISDVQLRARAEELISALRGQNLKFGAAESCTGGLISKTITDIPGCSDVFYGGVVSYDNSVKAGVLGVDKKTLVSLGAVSADVAMQMAIGAAEALGVDIAAAVTGIAGPGGGTDEKPVGLVYIAVCAGGERVLCEKCKFDGTREEIRNATAYRAMTMALETIINA